MTELYQTVEEGLSHFEQQQRLIQDLTQPLAKRTHAAFYLRTQGSIEAMNSIVTALNVKENGPLFRHELAYILGQMQHHEACPTLERILDDDSDDLLVRHESGEALGAIGHPSSIPMLQKYSTHEAPEISETCIISLDLIDWKTKGEKASTNRLFMSVDPAPALPSEGETVPTVPELQARLLDRSLSLFARYRALFSLRDINTDESALALVEGLSDPSALFRHEVAYVLGQMEKEVTVPALARSLSDLSEHRMVRHEAAEALGAIATPEAESLLKEFRLDGEGVVQQSCDVALDTIAYWTAFEKHELEEQNKREEEQEEQK